jgi:hypothetical protein
VCSAGKAADFTVHHLVPIDQAALDQLFDVNILAGDGTKKQVQPLLREWGLESGPIKTYEEAVSGWNASSKPKGDVVVGLTLGDMADVVRSKNAGVNEITYDCIFQNQIMYEQAKCSPSLDAEKVGTLLKRPVLGVFCDDASLAIKITCDREINAGSQGDRDVYGAQQHRLLVDLPL